MPAQRRVIPPNVQQEQVRPNVAFPKPCHKNNNDVNETVNTLGQPLYAKQEPREFGRGTDLHTQSNPLPMCHRPGLLVKLLAS